MAEDYQMALKSYAADDTIKLILWRNKKRKTVFVKASVFPIEMADDLAYKLLGIAVKNLAEQKRFRYPVFTKEGVVITEVRQRAYLAQIGARPGDVIRQIDEISIKNRKDFQKAVVKYRKKPSVVMLLQREDQLYYITVKLN